MLVYILKFKWHTYNFAIICINNYGGQKKDNYLYIYIFLVITY